MLVTELGLAADVGQHLEKLRVRWLVGGSVASSILGIPRATVDIDLVADLRGAHVTALYEALSGQYYVDRDTMRWAVSTRRSFNAIHQDSLIKVDVFCAGDDPLSRRELERRVFFDLEVGRIPVCSSEDIILQKLVWWREAGGSERQWRDALGVVQVRSADLDRAYLDSNAAQLDLGEAVQRLFQEAAQLDTPE